MSLPPNAALIKIQQDVIRSKHGVITPPENQYFLKQRHNQVPPSSLLREGRGGYPLPRGSRPSRFPNLPRNFRDDTENMSGFQEDYSPIKLPGLPGLQEDYSPIKLPGLSGTQEDYSPIKIPMLPGLREDYSPTKLPGNQETREIINFEIPPAAQDVTPPPRENRRVKPTPSSHKFESLSFDDSEYSLASYQNDNSKYPLPRLPGLSDDENDLM
jgi:hypothetical protein